MTNIAVRVEVFPGADPRDALLDALDRAGFLQCPVVMAVKGGSLFLHPGTLIEDAERAYDGAVADFAKREAEAKSKRPAKAAPKKPAAKVAIKAP